MSRQAPRPGGRSQAGQSRCQHPNLTLPDLPPKGDVSDWLANGGTRDRLEELAAGTPYWEQAADKTVDGVPPPYHFSLLRDLQPILHRREIVRDLIPRRAFGEVHADSSGGKSAIIVDLGLHVAAGLLNTAVAGSSSSRWFTWRWKDTAGSTTAWSRPRKRSASRMRPSPW